jgi:hypothetical protein
MAQAYFLPELHTQPVLPSAWMQRSLSQAWLHVPPLVTVAAQSGGLVLLVGW